MSISIINNMYYAGIGSRKTPQEMLRVMTDLSQKLSKLGYILRSGGADGADVAFERGCDIVGGLKEIYLPWKNFNNNPSNHYIIPEKAFEIASKHHSNWTAVITSSKNFIQGQHGTVEKLMARNVMQILGKDLKSPVKFVICYADVNRGVIQGGTGMACRLADSMNIPILNLKVVKSTINDVVIDNIINNIKKL